MACQLTDVKVSKISAMAMGEACFCLLGVGHDVSTTVGAGAIEDTAMT